MTYLEFLEQNNNNEPISFPSYKLRNNAQD